MILSPRNPLASARKFIAVHHTQDSHRTIHRYRGSFYTYTGTGYRETLDEEIRSHLYRFLDQAQCQNSHGNVVPFEPNRNKVLEVLEALKAEALLSPGIERPAWLLGNDASRDDEILACKNGLLDLSSQELLDHTPRFFGHEALEFEYDPQAPEPKRWIQFLKELWSDDPASISTLQEWCGYALTPDTRQQKILLIVGPKRSGKGTIGRLLRKLLGTRNVSAPTFSSLSQNFGLAPLIDKLLAIISDARLSHRADQGTVAERLLSISGEDALTIDRKYREGWTGTLPTRLMILTNELPKIQDASGALSGRFIVLLLTKSFYGYEDTLLTERLAKDRPGILNWALDGRLRLQKRGHFVQPESAAGAISELEELASPISAFIQDRCVIGPKFSASRDELFKAWVNWCESQGQHPGTKATFGRDLRAAVPTIKDKRLRVNDVQTRFYQGIELKKKKFSLKASLNPKLAVG